MLYWFLKIVLIGPVARLLFRPWTEGEENVPRHGAAILASNHLSFSDSIFLPLVLHRRITFPAKMEYFTAPGVTGRLKALFFRGTGQIPIDRSGGRASRAAIDAGLSVLARGELFGIYPEGTRSPDGRLHRGKTGVARMALEAGVPIVPVAMIDTDKAQPTGQKIPTITRVGVRFGSPIDVSSYAGRADDREALREITDRVMAELARLSGRPYVDEYAATRKAQLAAKTGELLRTARAETAVAAAKAEDFIASARTESAARAEQLIAGARAESAAVAAKAEEFLTQARVDSAARAESLVEAARSRVRPRDDEQAGATGDEDNDDRPAGNDHDHAPTGSGPRQGRQAPGPPARAASADAAPPGSAEPRPPVRNASTEPMPRPEP